MFDYPSWVPQVFGPMYSHSTSLGVHLTDGIGFARGEELKRFGSVPRSKGQASHGQMLEPHGPDGIGNVGNCPAIAWFALRM